MVRAIPQIGQRNSTLETLHPKLLDSMGAFPEYITTVVRNLIAQGVMYVPIS